MKIARVLILLLALSLSLGVQPGLAVDEYDDSQSHPLRIVAYLAHPVAFLVEWTIFRPFHFLVSGAEPLEAFFGHKPHPPILAEPAPLNNYGVRPRATKVPDTKPASRVSAPDPLSESVRVVEIPVDRLVVKEVPKVVEVEKFILPAIAFRFDSAELTDHGKGEVYLAAQKLKQKSNIVIVIEGHTDNVGTEEYNQQLGMRRAQAVMKELASLGIDPERMSAASHGLTKPLIDQDKEWARAVNRRVELHVKAN
jgi:outer membrane protein OmpA-like peptidoglycan-associated protein